MFGEILFVITKTLKKNGNDQLPGYEVNKNKLFVQVSCMKTINNRVGLHVLMRKTLQDVLLIEKKSTA